ncbi:uncharacterized protein LOC124915607 isoform X2 [Impatiens glandulifera]|uniref:uncharacterized protein LOC124915607 isoform X2 n=1 Tax=Impatiens glandulifera TaxID=253017 RepID=UPI001FB193E9|nr:uncharacterized protein LOC124915607 isoform X2 [Impatiens glandulifera]
MEDTNDSLRLASQFDCAVGIELLQSDTIQFQSLTGKIEKGSLLLSLCIFGKDFKHVKKFLGCDIISFYYGNKFYESDEYRKWSDCKKAVKGTIFLGKWIFNGFRLEELLNRLSTHVSEEGEKSISQASKLFKDRKMTLVEFVLTLKDITGTKNLVEAVAIGKGKKDLTRMMRGPRKRKLDLPDGLTCFSSLTPAQIIEFLSGSDIHKRKGAQNDGLFWEAVWPLLLARGWHSEQLRSWYTKTESLVFLVPGVAKFSRRGGLVKGMHYFDSALDVLNKVFSDPSLLEAVKEEEEPLKECENHDSISLFCNVVDTINHIDSENGMDPILLEEVDGSSSEPEPAKKQQKKMSEEPRPLFDLNYPPPVLFDLNYPPPVPDGFDPCGIFLTKDEDGLDCNEPKKPSDEEEQTTTVQAIENGVGRGRVVGGVLQLQE